MPSKKKWMGKKRTEKATKEGYVQLIRHGFVNNISEINDENMCFGLF